MYGSRKHGNTSVPCRGRERKRESNISCVSRWLKHPYRYGKITHMKKTLNIDDDLFSRAKAACGAATDTETVRLGLQAQERHEAYQNLRALIGSEPNAQDVPRRRERPRTKGGAD